MMMGLITVGGQSLHCLCDYLYLYRQTGGKGSAGTTIPVYSPAALLCSEPSSILICRDGGDWAIHVGHNFMRFAVGFDEYLFFCFVFFQLAIHCSVCPSFPATEGLNLSEHFVSCMFG